MNRDMLGRSDTVSLGEALRLLRLHLGRPAARKTSVPLEEALDNGWKLLADCFEPAETGIASKLTDQFWPKTSHAAKPEPESDQSDKAEEESTNA